MQSFKYAIYTEKPRRPRPHRVWRLILAAAVVSAAGSAGWMQRAHIAAHGSQLLTWMLGDTARANEGAQEAELSLRQGDQHLGRGEYRTALKCYADAMRQHPENLKGWSRVRLASLLLGETKSPDLDGLLPKRESRARHWVQVGRHNQANARLHAARSNLAQALELAPESASAHLALAVVLADLGQLDQGIEHAQKAVEIAPDSLEAIATRFSLELRRGETERACQEGITSLKAHLQRTRTYQALPQLAETYLHQGLSLSDVRVKLSQDAPGATPTVRQLSLMEAYLRHYQSNPNWHRDSFDRVKELAEQTRQPGLHASDGERGQAANFLLKAHQARAKRFLDRSDLDAARRELGHALSLYKSVPKEAHRLADLQAERARLLMLANQPNEALQALEMAVKLNPQHKAREEMARMQAGMGMTLLSAGRAEAAREHMAQALRFRPTDDRLLARYFQTLGAEPSLRTTLQCARAVKDPDVGHILTRLVRGLGEIGKPKEAQSILRLAGNYKLGQGRLAALRAEAALAAGKTEKARESLLLALEHQADVTLWLRLSEVEHQLSRIHSKNRAARMKHLIAAHDAARHGLEQSPEGQAGKRLIAVTIELAQMHLSGKDAKAAETIVSRAALLDPAHPDLAMLLADARRVLKQPEGVIIACREGLDGIVELSDPRHAKLRWRLGRQLRELGRHQEALDELAKGVGEASDAPKTLAAQIWYELAFVHAKLEQREEALNAIRQYATLARFDPHKTSRTKEVNALEAVLAQAR